MSGQLTWRAATPADEDLLQRLFAEVKTAEFAPLQLAPQQLEPLIAMQYRARQTGYAQQFPGALDMILCMADGTPVGRHLIERRIDRYYGIDLAVLTAFRCQGIGRWALEQIQQLAALESVPFRLRVIRTNRARKLYERLGFIAAAADEVSFEMEWRPPSVVQAGLDAATPVKHPPTQIVCDTVTLPRIEVIERITAFLHGIGLKVEFSPVPSTSLLPGLQMIRNGLRVDTETLLYPGDMLHEAGHLALMTEDRRYTDFPVANDPAEEIGALAWSYAAAVHLGLPSEVVFHEHGYKGQSRALIAEFAKPRDQIGLPMLWWTGLTTQQFPNKPSIYPRMLRWLREGSSTTPEAVGFDASDPIEGLRWTRLPLRFDPTALQADVAAIPEEAWQAHFNQQDYEGEWSVLALRSRSGATSDIVALGMAEDFCDTPLLASLPALRAVLDSFRFPLKSVRLMRLHAGSRIHEHRDRDLTLDDGEMRLHVPVFTSDAVEFFVSGERLFLREGECWYIDFSLPHRIVNSGTEHRVHLVIDAVATEAAIDLLRQSVTVETQPSREWESQEVAVAR